MGTVTSSAAEKECGHLGSLPPFPSPDSAPGLVPPICPKATFLGPWGPGRRAAPPIAVARGVASATRKLEAEANTVIALVDYPEDSPIFEGNLGPGQAEAKSVASHMKKLAASTHKEAWSKLKKDSPFGISASWLPVAPRLGSFLLLRRLPTCWRKSVLRVMDIDILSFGASNMSKGKNNYFNIKESSRLSQGTHDRKELKFNKGKRKAFGLECWWSPLCNRVKKLEDDKNEEDGRCTGANFGMGRLGAPQYRLVLPAAV
ncbi:unnamed protein product [Polarella glacialis]|uniref:Uncharacterized protein n=1 Tax=Polarella glacialis TaxID=89957 RepID=A0A813H086_POLGL|nr:unnamed protein product [Polarella glacialis]